MDDLKQRYNYVTNIIQSPEATWNSIQNKTIIPYQVEVQPGPLSGPICWLKCPYCYGGAASDSGKRLTPERYVEIMHELADGGVNKVVFAGYATDPLKYKYLHDLVKVSVDAGQVVGFHTKALEIDERLLKLLTERKLAEKSYFSVSVDAGTDEIYNRIHGIENSDSKLLSRVIRNISELTQRRRKYGNHIDISATYLVNPINCHGDEITASINRLRSAGVDLIRFTFPQMPRKGVSQDLAPFVPDRDTVEKIMPELTKIVERENSRECQIIIRDMDKEFGIIDLHRTTPCFARFIFPTIGFDGRLYHCSESASPDFHEHGLDLGDLSCKSFWDCYYEYDSKNIKSEIQISGKIMERAACKCDRKEHGVNAVLNPLAESSNSGTQGPFKP